MKRPFQASAKIIASSCIIAAAMLGVALRASAQLPSASERAIPNFDIRSASAQDPAELAKRTQEESRLASQVPATVDYDPLTGAPKFIRAQSGFLTGPHGQGGAVSAATALALPANDPYLPVKAFLNEHADLFGHGAEALSSAKILHEDVGAHNGLRTVAWQQQLDGIPVFEGVLIGNITKNGELVTLSSQFLPNLSQSADAGVPNRSALESNPTVSIQQAILNASQSLGDSLSINDIVTNVAPNETGYQAFRSPAGPVHARLVWLPLNRNVMRLGWEIFILSQSIHEGFQVVVAADTGEILLRRNTTKHISDATYNVYTSDSPSPFSPGWPTPNVGQPPLTSRTSVTIAALSTNASPNGWIDDGNNTIVGNNAEAYLDRNDDYSPDRPQPQGNPSRVFDFPLDLTQDPTNYADASQVQLFYLLNVYHDRLYDLGFTESAGNYQDNNFGRGGLGNDHVLGHVQDGADLNPPQANNSYWIGAPDGFNGDEHMFIFTGPNPDRDGSLDAEVVYHETTHGTSERLVGAGVLISQLQTAGMGEGWSDFYAECLLSQPGDDPNAVYAMGGYVTYQFFGLSFANYYFGIRHYPYCTDLSKNPFTFKDIDPNQVIPHSGVPLSPLYPFTPLEADEVHHQGEVWCATLWEVRANLIGKYGYAGNQLALQLATDGMKLGPANPNFLQARDAIVLADQVDNGGANLAEIWRGFAKRGMGISATSPDSSTTVGVHEAFDLPGLQIISTNLPGGNGNGVIDSDECNTLYLGLRNLGAIGQTNVHATLTTTNEHVIITGISSTYPNLPPGASGTNAAAFQFSTSPSFVCGTPVTFVLAIKSDEGTSTNTFTLPSGSPGAPLQFSSTTPVIIPDLSSADSPVTVSGFSTPIIKATVSLYITHTYDSDLLLELISPDGVTNVLAQNVGGSGDNFGSTCAEGSETVFDDAASTGIALGSAPFIGTFKPARALSVYIGKTGTNVNGTWHLHVVDQVAIDSGAIQCWTLSLTPSVCTDGGGECPGSDLGIGGNDTPDPVILGNNLVYSFSITNRGPRLAKGVTFSQTLPASMVFVSASISQGSISSSGGVVSGNIGNLSAGGVVTATVTVLPTQAGTFTSSASTAAVSDPDPDLSNNSVLITSHVSPPTSDMAIGLVANPNPVLMGGNLTYTVSVTNNGPSAATGVVASNTLPASVAITGISPSQGSASVSGNIVLLNFGSLNPGGVATATISTIPAAQGTITATAKISANQFDPLAANNVASVNTSVTPAADLAVAFQSLPPSIVLGSNLTYTILATNLGPSTATGVLISHSLPANAQVISSASSVGTLSQSGNVINCDVGNLPLGGTVSMTVVVAITNAETASSSVSISGSLADPNSANNSANVSTIIAPPFVSVQPSSATLISESFLPHDGSIEVGETVTVQLRLVNVGNVPTTNLMAKLLATGGVTSPTATNQIYGSLAAGGFPVGEPFSFTASGVNGGTITATLQLSGDVSNAVSFTFTLPKVVSFANTNVIVIPDIGSATPYPSTVIVSGVTGLVGKVTATLSNLNHTYPHDVSVLLVSPSGANTLLMSHVADLSSVAGADVTFDDSAPSPLPESGSISSGSWQPTAYSPAPVFPTNAPPATNPPAGPYSAAMSTFNGTNPNGTWSLFVIDDVTGDQGAISNGWSLAITTVSPVNNVADIAITGVGSPSPVLAGDLLTNTFTIVNNGPNTATAVAFTNVVPAGATLISASVSTGSVSTNGNTVVADLGNMNSGANATVVVVMTPITSGVLTNTANVAATEADVAPGNNTASISTTVNLPLADVAVGAVSTPGTVVSGSNLVYTITVTNNGPGKALNVVVTDTLPPSVTFLSSSAGEFASGKVTNNLGTLAPGTTGTFAVTVRAGTIGTITNNVSISTGSSDSISANNFVAVTNIVRAPAVNILAVAAKLVSESFSPPDGTVDPGETVSVSLTLTNVGELDTTSLNATLLNTGGVTASSGSQNYGAIVHKGAAVSRTFGFTASSSASGVVVATLQLQDGANNLGTVAFTFVLPQTNSFANTNSIIIPDHGLAGPYPSAINVSGLTGLVSKVTVTLNGFTHSFPHDVGMLLVSPSGAKSIVMTSAGGGISVSNLTLTFDDSAAAALSDSAEIVSGTYKPSLNTPIITFPTPAPVGPATNSFAQFAGSDPNGNWSLFVLDDTIGDAGIISGGWSIAITTVSPINASADLALSAVADSSTAYVGSQTSFSLLVSNKGPSTATSVVMSNTLPAGSTFNGVVLSQGSFSTNGDIIVCNFGTLTIGSTATATFTLTPGIAGSATDSATVSGSEADLFISDNSAAASVTVINILRPRLTGSVVKANHQFELTLVGQPNVNYIIQASSNLISWTAISTNTAAPDGTFLFSDTNAPSLMQRFYRALAAP
jgi:uncharacterized repeat protein (TIGR01451 family)